MIEINHTAGRRGVARRWAWPAASRRLVALATLVLLPSLALAETSPASLTKSSAARIGEKAITKYAKPLKVGNRVAADGTAFRVYRVVQAQGDWLWLESGATSGWARAGDVVPLDQAADYFTREIADHPKAASAYACRAIVRQELGEYDLAIADYGEAIRLDQDAAWAYHNRGLVWHQKRDYDKAIADCNEAIRLDPKHAGAYRTRASAWHQKQDYDRAIADYAEAIRLDPEHALAYRNRGRAWHQKQDYDRAIADYAEAIRLDPRRADAYHCRACAWHKLQDYDKALADYDEAIRLDPEHAHARHNRGLAWYEMQRYDRAMADYDEAIRLDPTHAQAHGNLAWLCATCPEERHRDGRRAAASALKACELTGWDDWRCIHALAAAYAEQGDFDNAVKHADQALSMAPAEHKRGAEQQLEAYKSGKPHRESAVD